MKKSLKAYIHYIYIAFLFNLISFGVYAQEPDIRMTGNVSASPLPADSVTSGTESPAGQITDKIQYEAQRIYNDVEARRTILTGRARVAYQSMWLTAARITVDWESGTLTAEGRLDTVWVRTSETDSVRRAVLAETPEFSESGEVMNGERMIYNFETRKGRVTRGRTEHGEGFYLGRALKLVGPNTVNVGDGVFTTCDKAEDPHFHFWMKKMKIVNKELVVAKPVVMYIGHIPVAAVPFAYFPIRSGRQSGFVLPKYGVSSLEGRYLRDFGYYWAPSDYFDIKGTMSYFENSGVLFREDFRYNVRYKLSGNISGSLTRKNFEVPSYGGSTGSKERRWDLSISHSQDINPSTKLTIYGQFVSSGNFYREMSANREYRMQQELRSNAKLSRRWGTSGRIELFMNQTRDLDTDKVSETMPKITISNNWQDLVPKPKRQSGSRREERWYHAIRVPYSFNITAERDRRWNEMQEIFVVTDESGHTVYDSLGNAVFDTLSGYDSRQRVGWDHTLRIYASPKLFGWLNVTPSISYQETWLNHRNHYSINPETNQTESQVENGFYAIRSFQSSLALNTKIYGIFRPAFLKDVTLRHVATPQISLSYNPDFSQDRFGYYQTIKDTSGEERKIDRYTESLYGLRYRSAAQSMGISLNNVFQMKTGEGEDAKKYTLFSWNLTTGYNWKSESFKWNNLSSRLQARPHSSVDVSVTSQYSFYDTDSSGNAVNRLLGKNISINDWKSVFQKPWLRMTSFNASVGFRLQGKAKGGRAENGAGGNPAPAGTPMDQGLGTVPGDRFNMNEDVGLYDLPWRVSGRLNYTVSKSNPLMVRKTFWVNTDVELQLTQKWKLSYRARFDLEKGQTVSQDVVLYRDLHCWEARIVWTPTGYAKQFYFKLNIKAPLLKDIKVEQRKGGRSYYGY